MATATNHYEEIEEAVLHLPLLERSKLMTRLLESLEQEQSNSISPEWREELWRRVRDVDAGKSNLIPQEEVWHRVNERFGTKTGE